MRSRRAALAAAAMLALNLPATAALLLVTWPSPARLPALTLLLLALVSAAVGWRAVRRALREAEEAWRDLAAMVADRDAVRERFDLAQEVGGIGAWVWDTPRDEGHVSDTYKQMHGLSHVEGPLRFAQVRAVIHPDDLAGYSERLALATQRREASTNHYRVIRPDGSVRWIAAKGRPLFDEDGQRVGSAGIVRDVTAEREAEAALQESQTRLELAIVAAGVGVWEWRLDTGEMIYSARAREICGLPAEGPIDLDLVRAVTHQEDLPRTSAQAERALHSKLRDTSPYEYRILRPSGEVRWVTAHGHAVFEGPPGAERAVRYIGALLDVTEAREREDRLRLLAGEVDHRANNLLMVVQGAVELSRADSMEALKAVIVGRLHALARAHQLLSEARWRGADLRSLVEEELLAFTMGQASRVRVDGADLALPAAAAQAVAMALHELATNAAKYGALSRPEGRIQVSWTRRPAANGPALLLIRWVESGGPAVSRPTRTGFGSSVLKRALGGALGGDTVLDWRPEGLVCELRLPLAEEAAPAQA